LITERYLLFIYLFCFVCLFVFSLNFVVLCFNTLSFMHTLCYIGWWEELRDEIKNHAKTLCCTHIIGYSESCTIYGDVCILSATGTAAVVKSGVHPAIDAMIEVKNEDSARSDADTYDSDDDRGDDNGNGDGDGKRSHGKEPRAVAKVRRTEKCLLCFALLCFRITHSNIMSFFVND
jgi:hypothetical protein